MHEGALHVILADEADTGKRLDTVVVSHIPTLSRSYASTLISEGDVRIRGTKRKPGYRVKPGDSIQVRIPPPTPASPKPEPIEIDICYEDHSFMVINKQAGLVTHPAPGHDAGTLVNALLYHRPSLRHVGERARPGIVHRLDRDTSGLLIVAKTASSLDHLALQFKSRRVEKGYIAAVYGEMELGSGTIALPIARHPVDRKRMSTAGKGGREARTAWSVRERFQGASLLDLKPETGRTHQIRVHCAAIGHPIIGDSVYAGRTAARRLPGIGRLAPRQMLHAGTLRFSHPVTQERVLFEAPIPDDMKKLIDFLRNRDLDEVAALPPTHAKEP